ncbi:DUF6262 family protein [Calothrix sp. NIES-2098]|uniref:DUF6262 family protein n=1 Tax=Calothrix sp. NIES-2098 TaxID=1954171 RepID=UPI000B5DE899|nr:hypothetical protein NIES2098_73750 [Calothrix sp. NIES-2098]
MRHERNIDGLRQSAEQRSQETLKRTDEAINRLVKAGEKITFQSVAKAAGVSVAYLYKYDEIKQRIDQLRKQQFPIKGLPQTQKVSEDSQKAVAKTLKERIKKLEAENRGLRDHIEVVQGIAMQVTDLKQQVEALKAENLKLKEKLEESDRTIASAQLQTVDDLKVSSLDKKRSKRLSINNKIQFELDELGVRINSTLSKLINSAPEELVLKAIDALKEALTNTEVRNPSGFLVEAIKNTWIPNEEYVQKVELDVFNEWYELARKKGLVLASQSSKNGILLYTNHEQWIPFPEMLIKYPIEEIR